MKLGRLIILPAFTACLAFGADKDIIQLQRDVVLLEEQIRQLQRNLDEKMASLTTLMQQSIDSSNKGNATLASLETGIRERMAEQQKNLVAPVATMTSKLDQMSGEFQGLRESVADLTERMNKMQAQIVDLGNSVRTLQSPPAPPPPGSIGGPGSASGTQSPPSGLSARQLYDTAVKDRSAGNHDLALHGFEEYLKYFANTELAPSAQFNIGQIYYDKADFTNAIRAFDAVLERFQENSRTPDAMYMKGMSLLRADQRTDAGKEFLALIQKYPNAEITAKARQQRKALGLNSPGAPAAAKRSRR
jgi:tol-pal system protein YbgF